MMKSQLTPVSLAISIATIVTLVGASFGIVKVEGEPPEREKTLLEERVESARQIRDALAKPIPPPEPLTPVTAKVERKPPTVAAVKANRPSVGKQARDAFAQHETGPAENETGPAENVGDGIR